MAVAASGIYVHATTSHLVTAVLPDKVRLGFEFEPAVVATGSTGHHHSARFAAMTGVVELDVGQLLATAALRHHGAPYGVAEAIAKETVLWWMWMGVSPGTKKHGPVGRLEVPAASNSGRLIEFSSSLGEAVALDLAISLFNIPYALWTRIPETDPQGMDFLAPGANGDLAIEAKAALGSGVAAKKKEILAQKAKRTAAEKYGFVTCYAMNGRVLTRKGSYVKVVDPPGDENPPRRDPIQALREHYLQIAEALGLEMVARLLRAALGQARETAEELARLRRLVGDRRAAGTSVRVGREVYLGKYFDIDRILASEKGLLLPDSLPRRIAFLGVSQRVVLAAVDEDEDSTRWLFGTEDTQQFVFTRDHDGDFGPVRYVGLADGSLRIDLTSIEQLLGEQLDLLDIGG